MVYKVATARSQPADRSLVHGSDGRLIIMAPSTTKMRSYHASGLSPKDEYLKQREYAKALTREFRL